MFFRSELARTLLRAAALSMALTACGPLAFWKGEHAQPAAGSQTTVAERGTLDPSAAWRGSGNYTDVDLLALPATEVCQGNEIFGQVGAAVCQSGTAAVVATEYDVAFGKDFFNSSGTLVTGAMANHGDFDIGSGSIPSPSAGYYSSITSSLTAADVCSGKNIFSSSGLATCESGSMNSGNTPATAINILTNKSAWDASGTVVDGTMANHGIWDVSTTTFPGAGYYSGASSSLSAGQVCKGSQILSANGIATCIEPEQQLMSGAYRDSGTTQLTVSEEVNTGSCPGHGGKLTRAACEADSGIWYPSWGTGNTYRSVPNLSTDDDGYMGTSYALRPINNCGLSGSIAERINECATANSASTPWFGESQGKGAEAIWKLVTRDGVSIEVWQDRRTGLLWSTLVTMTLNWCKASGSLSVGGTNSCIPGGGLQDISPKSACAENGSLAPALSETWTSGASVYSSSKGLMGLLSNNAKVLWRLPTLADYQQANIDGIRFVMPDMGKVGGSRTPTDTSTGFLGTPEWTATMLSNNHDYAFTFNAIYGTSNSTGLSRAVSAPVRCVGR